MLLNKDINNATISHKTENIGKDKEKNSYLFNSTYTEENEININFMLL